jgi:hypothetical protein
VAPAVKCARRPLLIVSASPHRTIAFDEPVATAVGELSLGEALAQPAVAVVRQHHVTRQLLAPERPRLRGIGLERNLLLHREPLRRPEDRGRLSRMLRTHAAQQIRPIRHLVAAAEHRMRYHRIDRGRGFESRRQACRRLVERRFLSGEAEPSRAVSARLTVIARRIVTCCQTTNAGSC